MISSSRGEELMAAERSRRIDHLLHREPQVIASSLATARQANAWCVRLQQECPQTRLADDVNCD